MVYEFTFSSADIGRMASLVRLLGNLPVEVFDGHNHRDICVALKDDLFTKLRNHYKPSNEDVRIRLNYWQIHLLYLVLKYAEYLTGKSLPTHENGRILLQLQPKLLHS